MRNVNNYYTMQCRHIIYDQNKKKKINFNYVENKMSYNIREAKNQYQQASFR